MSAKKTRIVVEVTTNKKVTEREALRALTSLLDSIDLQARPAYRDVYVDKLNAKRFSRVYQSEKLKDGSR